jgi:hypothetical protein
MIIRIGLAFNAFLSVNGLMNRQETPGFGAQFAF